MCYKLFLGDIRVARRIHKRPKVKQDDLVVRMRRALLGLPPIIGPKFKRFIKVAAEGATEIERLRATLQEVTGVLSDMEPSHNKAIAALDRARDILDPV
jgi:hypothetical protein